MSKLSTDQDMKRQLKYNEQLPACGDAGGPLVSGKVFYEDGTEIELSADDLRPLVPPAVELKGTKPVVIYFSNGRDRQAFIDIVKEAMPNAKAMTV